MHCVKYAGKITGTLITRLYNKCYKFVHSNLNIVSGDNTGISFGRRFSREYHLVMRNLQLGGSAQSRILTSILVCIIPCLLIKDKTKQILLVRTERFSDA